MANFKKHFKDGLNGLSNSASVKAGTYYRFTILTENLVRLEYSRLGIFNDAPSDFAINRNFPLVQFKVEEDDKHLIITTSVFTLQYNKNKMFTGLSFDPDSNLKVKINGTDKIWYYGYPDDKLFDAQNFSLDDFKNNLKLHKGLFSPEGFVAIKDNKPLLFNELGMLYDTSDETIDVYLFVYNHDFNKCLKDYFTLTGNPSIIPRYALGLWWNRDKIYSYDDTKKLVKSFKDNGIPLSVLLLGEFWHVKNKDNYLTNKSGFSFNQDLFPSPSDFIKEMHETGVKVGLNIDFIDGVSPLEPSYEEFKKDINGDVSGNIPFNAFDKMFIINYFEYIVGPLDKLDIDFYWLDYKANPKFLRAMNYYHIKDSDQSEYKRPIILSRNTEVAPHRNGIIYSGETIASWDTLKILPYYNNCAANMGISWISHDVGGYKDGIEDSDLYIRYVEFSTFNPIFRFSAKRGHYYKREPWAWDFNTCNIAKNYINFRQRLIPYIYSEAYNYSKDAKLLIRPLFQTYLEFYQENDFKNEYYFGNELFVCPIIRPINSALNATRVRLFFPKGTWYDFETGREYTGGKRYILFYPDSRYPVFATKGSIIPMTSKKDFNGSYENPEKLDIHIFPGKSNSYQLYEDDGITKLYKQGLYNITSIDYSYTEDNYSVIIGPKEGKTTVIPNKRDYNIIFRNTNKPEDVYILVDGEPLKKYEMDIQQNNVIISISNIDPSKNVQIRITGKSLNNSNKNYDKDLDYIINDAKIKTQLKESLEKIIYSKKTVDDKISAIKKLASCGLNKSIINNLCEYYDYLKEI